MSISGVCVGVCVRLFVCVSSLLNIYTICWIVLSVICSWHSVALLSVPAAYATRCSLPPNAIFHQGNLTADKLIRRISSQQKLKVSKQKNRFLGFWIFLYLFPHESLLHRPLPKLWAADLLLLNVNAMGNICSLHVKWSVTGNRKTNRRINALRSAKSTPSDWKRPFCLGKFQFHWATTWNITNQMCNYLPDCLNTVMLYKSRQNCWFWNKIHHTNNLFIMITWYGMCLISEKVIAI